ncbi:hypothetical protein KM803_06380 [Clostridium tyrobutyricum]|uniref:hypothetical protein n=1 Tax=Clostridium tyrobutyricum TaxID=1519 RepID=UPI001C395C5A|nr:hypothetical protein [Clostridium tyrobutyricum]MBV4430965.1 hypothetical protein [Clostridium tyrobutyricum]
MIESIKIELEKLNFNKYIKSAIAADIIILIFLLCVFFIFTSDPIKGLKVDSLTRYSTFFTMIDNIVRAIFMILSSVLISNIIIRELKNKKMNSVFSNSIDVRKTIISKIIIVFMFTFLIIILSNIFLEISFYFLNKIFNLVPDKLNLNFITINTLAILMYSITSSIMNLISMYFGIITKSIFVTTIVSIVLVCIVCSYNNGFSLNSIKIIPLSLAALGIFTSFLSIKHMENLYVKDNAI